MNKIRLYNTLTRQIEDFVPQNPAKVKIYTCGPTVYSTPHVGNLAAYIYWDLLTRTLEANHYTPYRILNLTDVGHLTDDGDNGEDKLEKGARLAGKTVWEVAENYIHEFQDAYESLHLQPPAAWARATDYIPQDIAIVDLLTQKGFTYETSDGIYFDTAKFSSYADFARLDLENLKAGARVEMSHEKHNPSDFAVWKFISPGESHAMRWDYLGRPGYPGWHLECSTIIHEELGEPIDIHCGGIDHIPVHHTNEIAQSEAAFEQRLSNYWLHCNHLTVAGEKISKSLGNGYSLQDISEKGFSPLDFKMWVLQGHYQSERNFTLDDLEAARVRRLKWRNQVALSRQKAPADSELPSADSNLPQAFSNLPQTDSEKPQVLSQILQNLNENLNSPQAFALIDSSEIDSLATWQAIEVFFGLGLLDDPEPTAEQLELIQERTEARTAQDFERSDAIRDQLAAQNFKILDTPTGQVWQYLK